MRSAQQRLRACRCIRYLYSRFVFEICIRDLYSKFVFETCIRDLYSKSVFEICIRNLYSIFVFEICICYVFIFIMSILSCYFYQHIAPEHFGDPIISYYSMFKVFTIEGWNNIPDEMVKNGKMGYYACFFTKLY